MTKRFAELARRHPVVVTGMGAFTPAGPDVPHLWEKILGGESPAVWTDLTVGQDSTRNAVCRAPLINEQSLPQRMRKMDRSVQMAYVAAMEAWRDAGLEGVSGEGDGLVAGTSRGPVEATLEAYRRLGAGRMWPTAAANTTMSGLSGALSVEFGATGPCMTLSTACASGAAAIALAADQIVMGKVERVLCGGAESPLNEFVLSQLHSAGVVGSHEEAGRACRPFDLTRNGTVLGEGAAFLVLESETSALARGARIHARLGGWELGSSGEGRTGIEDDGACLHRLIEGTLAMAGLRADEVDYINAHGTGTVINDLSESQAIRRLEGGDRIPVSSTKPVTGHCMGAASVIEAVIGILALAHGKIPPSANYQMRDPECSLNVVTAPRSRSIRSVLSNSTGFWGKNASLLFQSTTRTIDRLSATCEQNHQRCSRG